MEAFLFRMEEVLDSLVNGSVVGLFLVVTGRSFFFLLSSFSFFYFVLSEVALLFSNRISQEIKNIFLRVFLSSIHAITNDINRCLLCSFDVVLFLFFPGQFFAKTYDPIPVQPRGK